MLQSMGLRRIEHDLAIERKQEEHNCDSCKGQILFGELYEKKVQAKRKDTTYRYVFFPPLQFDLS